MGSSLSEKVLDLIDLLFPPKLTPGWERLRRRIGVKDTVYISVGVGTAFIFAIVLDLDMTTHPILFVAACLIRYLVICPTLFSVVVLWKWKRDFLIRRFENIMLVIVFISFIGIALITVPLYLGTKPPNSAEFSPSRVMGVWVTLVVLPLHFTTAAALTLMFVISFLAIAGITSIWSGYPIYWIGVNAVALFGVATAGLFTSYNRDIAEYRFFRALSNGVRQMKLSMEIPDVSRRPGHGVVAAHGQTGHGGNGSKRAPDVIDDQIVELSVMSRSRSKKRSGTTESMTSKALSQGFASLTEGAGTFAQAATSVSVTNRERRDRTVTDVDLHSRAAQHDDDPEVPEPILQSLYKALDREVKRDLVEMAVASPSNSNGSAAGDGHDLEKPKKQHSFKIDTGGTGTEADERSEQEAMEASRISMMMDAFDDSIRVRLYIFKEFKDWTTERAFQRSFAVSGVRIRSVRFSIAVTALLLIVLGGFEAYVFADPSTHGVLTRLMVLRYGVMIPVFIVMIVETYAKRRFIALFHPLVLCMVLIVAVVFQAVRLQIVVGYWGTSMAGMARLYTQSYFTNIHRMLMYVACGVQARMPWAFVASFGGIISEIVIVYGYTDLRIADTWEMGILYPIMIFALGVWRSLKEDDKARLTFLLTQLTKWKVQQDMAELNESDTLTNVVNPLSRV